MKVRGLRSAVSLAYGNVSLIRAGSVKVVQANTIDNPRNRDGQPQFRRDVQLLFPRRESVQFGIALVFGRPRNPADSSTLHSPE